MAKSNAPTIVNRKARHEYHFIDTFEAGIVLKGTEVKSLREGKVQMGDAFCIFIKGELFIRDMHISHYTHGNIHNVEEKRDRKLLLGKKELKKLKSKLEQKGLTMVAVKLFFNERGFVKIVIALAKGKKLFDKRDDLKTKDTQREISRQLKDL